MEEIRIDCLNQTEQELAAAIELPCRNTIFGCPNRQCEVRPQCDCHARLPDDVCRWNHDR